MDASNGHLLHQLHDALVGRSGSEIVADSREGESGLEDLAVGSILFASVSKINFIKFFQINSYDGVPADHDIPGSGSSHGVTSHVHLVKIHWVVGHIPLSKI
jgi:hypothetical protein